MDSKHSKKLIKIVLIDFVSILILDILLYSIFAKGKNLFLWLLIGLALWSISSLIKISKILKVAKNATRKLEVFNKSGPSQEYIDYLIQNNFNNTVSEKLVLAESYIYIKQFQQAYSILSAVQNIHTQPQYVQYMFYILNLRFYIENNQPDTAMQIYSNNNMLLDIFANNNPKFSNALYEILAVLFAAYQNKDKAFYYSNLMDNFGKSSSYNYCSSLLNKVDMLYALGEIEAAEKAKNYAVSEMNKIPDNNITSNAFEDQHFLWAKNFFFEHLKESEKYQELKNYIKV